MPNQDEQKPTACPDCGMPLAERKGKYGDFLGCTGYPDCKFIWRPTSVSKQRHEELLKALRILYEKVDKITKYFVEKNEN